MNGALFLRTIVDPAPQAVRGGTPITTGGHSPVNEGPFERVKTQPAVINGPPGSTSAFRRERSPGGDPADGGRSSIDHVQQSGARRTLGMGGIACVRGGRRKETRSFPDPGSPNDLAGPPLMMLTKLADGARGAGAGGVRPASSSKRMRQSHPARAIRRGGIPVVVGTTALLAGWGGRGSWRARRPNAVTMAGFHRRSFRRRARFRRLPRRLRFAPLELPDHWIGPAGDRCRALDRREKTTVVLKPSGPQPASPHPARPRFARRNLPGRLVVFSSNVRDRYPAPRWATCRGRTRKGSGLIS